MKTEILLVGYHQDQRTGHISARVKSRTTDGTSTMDGPEMVYGVDALAFRHRFNSNPEEFEAWIANQHRAYIGASQAIMEHLSKRKGMVIG